MHDICNQMASLNIEQDMEIINLSTLKKIYIMRKNIVSITIVYFLLVFLISCKNKEIPAYDVDFMFIEPIAGQVYTSGDDVHLEIDMQGTAPINNIEVLIINTASNDTVGNFETSTTEQFYSFDDHLVITVGVASSFKILANAWTGSYDNRVFEELIFTVNP